ncbi:glutamate--tRNA ligase [Patescibacteria group bacterium]|nr:glutamate--tRNA ligase [Patescibacteria group bacterium]MBU1703196.1 glutamate--tRNA ligase [Patescibacteria group bacterium]MBU1953520.1 glutamate--tRNA ligase [Patescibacteria group bacterium]
MIRTRFAPSPTGFLHVGGLRTALYNYLFAQHSNGKFLLRIEDTDQKRRVEGAEESLLNTLKLVGLDYDEGPYKEGPHAPYIQSQRTDIYRKYAQELIEKEVAYPCFCTTERLEEMRNKQQELKQAPMYDRACLKLTKEEIEAKKAANEPFVIRQKIPRGEKLRLNDLIRGIVVFETSTLDDQVLMKSDNFPTYHLANVVDDHLMEISHVIRGEEWLPSTPKHIMLYKALGWEPPQFAHIPLLLNKDKSKLSKRQGDVSVESYLEKGYLVPALINFIALLGWHPGKGEEQEIFTMEELVNKFDLAQVHKAGAIFDTDKLDWFNFQWGKKLHFKELEKIAKEIDPDVKIEENQRKEPVHTFSNADNERMFSQKRGEILLAKCEKHLKPQWTEKPETKAVLLKAIVTIEEKILKNPSEAQAHLECFFNPKDAAKALILNEKMKVDEAVTATALSEGLKALKDFDGWDSINKLQTLLLNLAKELNLKNGQLLWPLRVALSGEEFSPGTFEMLWALGKDESLKRINRSLQKTPREA